MANSAGVSELPATSSPFDIPDQPRTILDDEAVDRPIDRLPHVFAAGQEVEHRERIRLEPSTIGIELQLRSAASTEVK